MSADHSGAAETMINQPDQAKTGKAEKSSNNSLYQEVIPWIRDRIIEGKLAPGSRIPERMVCEELGISRTPLREAFKVLAAERLLTLLPNRGAIVTKLSFKDVDDAMQLMASVEGLAGELLCRHITDEQISELQNMQEQMSAHFHAGQQMDYFKVNQDIHIAIIKAANSEILLQTFQNIRTRFIRFRYAGNRAKPRWQSALREHEHILMSIEDRDPHLLHYLLRAHVLNGWEIAKQVVREELDCC